MSKCYKCGRSTNRRFWSTGSITTYLCKECAEEEGLLDDNENCEDSAKARRRNVKRKRGRGVKYRITTRRCVRKVETKIKEIKMLNKKINKRRKWECGKGMIHDIRQLLDCITLTGGVWWTQPKGGSGRFMNSSWVWSQQFRYLYMKIRAGKFYYPEMRTTSNKGEKNEAK